MSLLHTGNLLDSNFLGAIMEKTDDWDGKPHWERDPEVAEKYIQYVDCNVESSEYVVYQMQRVGLMLIETRRVA